MSDYDEVAEVLAEHTLHDNGKKWVCVMSSDVHPKRVLLCRWSRAYGRLNPDAAHRAHVADALMPLLARREAEARAEVVAAYDNTLATDTQPAEEESGVACPPES